MVTIFYVAQDIYGDTDRITTHFQHFSKCHQISHKQSKSVKIIITILSSQFCVYFILKRALIIHKILKHNSILLHIIWLYCVCLQVIFILPSLYNFGRSCRASGRSQQQDSNGHGFWMVHPSSRRVHHSLRYSCSLMGTGYYRKVSRNLNNLFTITYYVYAIVGNWTRVSSLNKIALIIELLKHQAVDLIFLQMLWRFLHF